MTDDSPLQEPPFLPIAKIWFALFWRTCLWMLPILIGGVLAGAVIGVVNAIAGGTEQTALLLARILGVGVGIGGGIWATYQAFRAVLGRSFGGWRLMLVEEDVSP